MAHYRLTVDTGGTFSDFVYVNDETREVSVAKIPSTPDDPSRAILAGVEELIARGEQQIACMKRDGEKLSPTPVPPALRAALAAYSE